MKNAIASFIVALAVVSVASATPSAQLVRSVKVVEGTTTNLYVGNGFGQVLYTFDQDVKGTPACYAKCAEAWPPYIITAEEVKTLTPPLGVVARTNGMLQLTVDGKPVYTYYLDRIEGDDKGDGVGGVWHDIDFK